MTRPGLDALDAHELRPGLWRWTAPHPEWTPGKDKPGGWAQQVGSVYYEPADDPRLVLIDPLVAEEGTHGAERFWSALDRDLARTGRGLRVLLGNPCHLRSTPRLRERYPDVEIWAHEPARASLGTVLTHSFLEETDLPGGIRAVPIEGLDVAETAYCIPAHRALVSADAILGMGGGRVAVAPASWAAAGAPGAARYAVAFRLSLRRLLDHPVDLLLVSHGEPVLKDGHRALADALDRPAWGEAT